VVVFVPKFQLQVGHLNYFFCHLIFGVLPSDAVVDWKDTSGFFNGKSGLVAIFTHHDTDPNSKKPRQRQSLAYSLDKGRTWIKYSDNPVLVNEEKVDFRDPKVFWYKQTNKWIMVLAAGDCIDIYSSPNLIEETRVTPLLIDSFHRSIVQWLKHQING
jgi:sucrose-6-phosphate hydrolase SacC (GH32 family)